MYRCNSELRNIFTFSHQVLAAILCICRPFDRKLKTNRNELHNGGDVRFTSRFQVSDGTSTYIPHYEEYVDIEAGLHYGLQCKHLQPGKDVRRIGHGEEGVVVDVKHRDPHADDTSQPCHRCQKYRIAIRVVQTRNGGKVLRNEKAHQHLFPLGAFCLSLVGFSLALLSLLLITAHATTELCVLSAQRMLKLQSVFRFVNDFRQDWQWDGGD